MNTIQPTEEPIHDHPKRPAPLVDQRAGFRYITSIDSDLRLRFAEVFTANAIRRAQRKGSDSDEYGTGDADRSARAA